MLGRQSEVLLEEAALDAALVEALNRVQVRPGAVSQYWRLYTVRADEVEFWQGAASHRDLRLRYRRDDADWVRERLWP